MEIPRIGKNPKDVSSKKRLKVDQEGKSDDVASFCLPVSVPCALTGAEKPEKLGSVSFEHSKMSSWNTYIADNWQIQLRNSSFLSLGPLRLFTPIIFAREPFLPTKLITHPNSQLFPWHICRTAD